MSLRPYQHEFVDQTLGALVEYDRVLSPAATGAGKTVMSAEIVRRCLPGGPVLFLADAKELVYQAADKLGQWSGAIPAVEMADDHATPGQDQLVVATTQSIARRLEKYPANYFRLIIVDEAHRNTLGDQAQKVLTYFAEAQVIGITATPFRSDRRQLGSFYQFITPVDAGLIRLIKEGFLSPITIKSVPVGIDIRQVRTVAGDYQVDDLGRAVAPHLVKCARLLAEHAKDRRTVVFLPLVESSRAFVDACRSIGLRAVHVDGEDRAGLAAFRERRFDVICNASLLTTGWDEPSVSCVMILRPTKSLVLYSQMVGRGTRTCDGKANLLLLDPLFLADDMNLIRPARLIAHTEDEATSMQAVIDGAGDMFGLDLLEARETAAELRKRALEARLAKTMTRKARTIDAVEFALALGDEDLANYEPEAKWEEQAPSPKQLEILEKNGFDPTAIRCKGHASKLLDAIFTRRGMGLASPKQLRWLRKFGIPNANQFTFEQASAILDARFGGRKRETAAA